MFQQHVCRSFINYMCTNSLSTPRSGWGIVTGALCHSDYDPQLRHSFDHIYAHVSRISNTSSKQVHAPWQSTRPHLHTRESRISALVDSDLWVAISRVVMAVSCLGWMWKQCGVHCRTFTAVTVMAALAEAVRSAHSLCESSVHAGQRPVQWQTVTYQSVHPSVGQQFCTCNSLYSHHIRGDDEVVPHEFAKIHGDLPSSKCGPKITCRVCGLQPLKKKQQVDASPSSTSSHITIAKRRFVRSKATLQNSGDMHSA